MHDDDMIDNIKQAIDDLYSTYKDSVDRYKETLNLISLEIKLTEKYLYGTPEQSYKLDDEYYFKWSGKRLYLMSFDTLQGKKFIECKADLRIKYGPMVKEFFVFCLKLLKFYTPTKIVEDNHESKQ